MKNSTLLIKLTSLLILTTSLGCNGAKQKTDSTSDTTNHESDTDADTEVKHDDNRKKQHGQSCRENSECASGSCSNGICTTATTSSCDTPTNPCGHCNDSACVSSNVGGTNNPIDLSNDPDNLQDSSDVVVEEDENGRPAVTVSITSNQNNYIWIANTRDGLISKINTVTYDEEAVYFTGPNGTSNDPSRTSINSFGDAFVANRSSKSVSKIAGTLDKCVDRNNNNTIDTSTGRSDIKPWTQGEPLGEDECILWNTPLDGGLVRGLAAQDYDPNTGDLNPVVWAGSYSARKLYKLDGETGNILFETPVPVTVYGIALDGSGNLWLSSLSNYFVRVDSKRCTSPETCTNDGVAGCTNGTEDACVIQKIDISHIGSTYGITVDQKQRVWLGGSKVFRYDPSVPEQSQRFAVSTTGAAGVQADDKGFIWAGQGAIRRIDAEDPSKVVTINGSTSRGVAVDLDGKIWGIPYGGPGLSVVTPGADINDNALENGVANSFSNAYTYSDMTGSQLRFVGKSRGFYSRKFKGCDLNTSDGTKWLKLLWEADTPEPSNIKISIRGALSQADLASATWYDVGTVPPLESPFDLAQFLEANGIANSNIIEVRTELITGRQNDAHRTLVAPKLYSLQTVAECKPKQLG